MLARKSNLDKYIFETVYLERAEYQKTQLFSQVCDCYFSINENTHTFLTNVVISHPADDKKILPLLKILIDNIFPQKSLKLLTPYSSTPRIESKKDIKFIIIHADSSLMIGSESHHFCIIVITPVQKFAFQ